MGKVLKFGGFGCLGIIVLLIALAAIGGNASKSTPSVASPTSAPAAVQAGAAAATTAPKPTDRPAPTSPPTAVPAPTSAFPSFGEGTKLVGTDIQPGTYRTKNEGKACYWARMSGVSGAMDEILANENATGPTVVTIAASDKAFKSTRCGTWSQDLSPLRADPATPFENGTFIVGVDVAPGTWRAESQSGCYWARLSDFSGQMGSILANENAKGSAIVQIAAGDKGFHTARCGKWTKAG